LLGFSKGCNQKESADKCTARISIPGQKARRKRSKLRNKKEKSECGVGQSEPDELVMIEKGKKILKWGARHASVGTVRTSHTESKMDAGPWGLGKKNHTMR